MPPRAKRVDTASFFMPEHVLVLRVGCSIEHDLSPKKIHF